MNKYQGVSIEVLEDLRVRTQLALDGAADASALHGSDVGKKWVKLLEADLSAVRCKYLTIKGTDSERLCSLAKFQGREEQLAEELDLLKGAGLKKQKLNEDYGLIMEAIGIARKKPPSR